MMKRVLYLLYLYRAFLIFVLLEAISLVGTFVRQGRPSLRSSNVTSVFPSLEKETQPSKKEKSFSVSLSHNYLMGKLHTALTHIKHYGAIQQENHRLLEENAQLREQLLRHMPLPPGAALSPPAQQESIAQRYRLIPAWVVNNTIIYARNYITLNRGARQGIAPGMGVITTEGVVGKVKDVSEHFSTVVPLLHTDVLVSAQISGTQTMGTIHWPGKVCNEVNLLYIPRHVAVKTGSLVVTSGYNAVFPPNVPIGRITYVGIQSGTPFYDIKVALSTPFASLKYVYVIHSALKQEKEVIEQRTKAFYEQN